MTHKLKTWPEFFSCISNGSKTFEVRKDDRNFKVGDRLYLEEYSPHEKRYTGSRLMRRVIYKLTGEQFGIKEGYCILGLQSDKWGQVYEKAINYQMICHMGRKDGQTDVMIDFGWLESNFVIEPKWHKQFSIELPNSESENNEKESHENKKEGY